jgi:hypothetical protein
MITSSKCRPRERYSQCWSVATNLIVRMFIQLGLRPEELFTLRRDDVGKELIRVDEASTKGQIKETKTEESAVNVYVPPDLMAELSAG